MEISPLVTFGEVEWSYSLLVALSGA